MFSINLEQICFSLNDNCNKNCNDCYVGCTTHNSHSVPLDKVEKFLEFITVNNESANRHISIDFMGGEMSEYEHLDSLSRIIKDFTKSYIIDDMRVTTYAPRSDNLIKFVNDMMECVDHLRYFIIRDLSLNELDQETIDYVERVSLLGDKVNPVVEHVLRPKDIPVYDKLLGYANQYNFVTIDICYPCGATDFTESDLNDLTTIYNDFKRKNTILNDIDFANRVSMFEINYSNISNIMQKIQKNKYISSMCKPFSSEIWLSPRGNIFPCAHMLKYDQLFDHNSVDELNETYFTNELNNKFIIDKNDELCHHCVVKSFCLQCKILPEILNMSDLNNINRTQEKCDRVLNHVKSTLENINEYKNKRC